jgi:hypothetical protein
MFSLSFILLATAVAGETLVNVDRIAPYSIVDYESVTISDSKFNTTGTLSSNNTKSVTVTSNIFSLTKLNLNGLVFSSSTFANMTLVFENNTFSGIGMGVRFMTSRFVNSTVIFRNNAFTTNLALIFVNCRFESSSIVLENNFMQVLVNFDGVVIFSRTVFVSSAIVVKNNSFVCAFCFVFPFTTLNKTSVVINDNRAMTRANLPTTAQSFLEFYNPFPETQIVDSSLLLKNNDFANALSTIKMNIFKVTTTPFVNSVVTIVQNTKQPSINISLVSGVVFQNTPIIVGCNFPTRNDSCVTRTKSLRASNTITNETQTRDVLLSVSQTVKVATQTVMYSKHKTLSYSATMTHTLVPTMTRALAPVTSRTLAPTMTHTLAPTMTHTLAPTITNALASTVTPTTVSTLVSTMSSTFAPITVPSKGTTLAPRHVTKTRTLSLNKVAVLPLQTPLDIARTIVSGTATASVMASSMIRPTVATQASRVDSTMSVYRCNLDLESLELSYFDFQIQTNIGSSKFSAIVGSVAIATAIVVGSYLANQIMFSSGFNHEIVTKCMVMFTSFVVSFYSPTILSNAFIVLNNSEQNGDWFISLGCVVFVLLICIMVSYTVLFKFPARNLQIYANGKEKYEDEVVNDFNVKISQISNLDESVPYVEYFGVYFDACRNVSRLVIRSYFVIDLWTALIFAIIDGSRPQSGDCFPHSVIMTVVNVAYFGYVLVFHPFAHRIEFGSTLLKALIQFGLSLCSVIAITNDEFDMYVELLAYALRTQFIIELVGMSAYMYWFDKKVDKWLEEHRTTQNDKAGSAILEMPFVPNQEHSKFGSRETSVIIPEPVYPYPPNPLKFTNTSRFF